MSQYNWRLLNSGTFWYRLSGNKKQGSVVVQHSDCFVLPPSFIELAECLLTLFIILPEFTFGLLCPKPTREYYKIYLPGTIILFTILYLYIYFIRNFNKVKYLISSLQIALPVIS